MKLGLWMKDKIELTKYVKMLKTITKDIVLNRKMKEYTERLP